MKYEMKYGLNGQMIQ